MGKVLGIDLGTTNSCMAVLENGTAEVVINSEGDRTTPSVVSYKICSDRSIDMNSPSSVGKIALNQLPMNPKNTINSVKRFIGRMFSELKPEDLAGISYDIVRADSGTAAGKALIMLEDNTPILPEVVSANVLRKLKDDASRHFGEEITSAVITVPAYFDDSQRKATKDAGRIAGLNVMRILSEPTAAALAYGVDERLRNEASGKQTDAQKKVLVFDLGGGTLDVTIIDITDTMDFETIAISGDNTLGGDKWDSLLAEWLAQRFSEECGCSNPMGDIQARARIIEAARKAKHDLSNTESTVVTLPFLYEQQSMNIEVTREQFEQITSELVRRCQAPIDSCLAQAGISREEIYDILLVGGSTRMPAIYDFIANYFGRQPSCTQNPDEVVAEGAAMVAASLEGEMIYGASDGILLIDTCPMSLGVKLADGRASWIIQANTVIPVTKEVDYHTEHDNQNNVELVILQDVSGRGPGNEPEFASDEGVKVIQVGELTGIPERPAKKTVISVKFYYDVDSILKVTATDRGSGRMVNFNATGGARESEETIQALAASANQVHSSPSGIGNATSMRTAPASVPSPARTRHAQK
jgi:molecular chaperone DnaK